MLTTAHFQVIQAASARTSSSDTSGANRMPPFAGPRAIECWTRYPVKTSMRPSSSTTGMLTVNSMAGWRRTLRIPSSNFSSSAASSKRCAADSQGLISLSTDGIEESVGITFILNRRNNTPSGCCHFLHCHALASFSNSPVLQRQRRKLALGPSELIVID